MEILWTQASLSQANSSSFCVMEVSLSKEFSKITSWNMDKKTIQIDANNSSNSWLQSKLIYSSKSSQVSPSPKVVHLPLSTLNKTNNPLEDLRLQQVLRETANPWIWQLLSRLWAQLEHRVTQFLSKERPIREKLWHKWFRTLSLNSESKLLGPKGAWIQMQQRRYKSC